jgi:hypothetical protein
MINPIPVEDASKLKDALIAFFKASAIAQASWIFPRKLEKLLNENSIFIHKKFKFILLRLKLTIYMYLNILILLHVEVLHQFIQHKI